MIRKWGNDGQLRGAVFEALVRHWAIVAGYVPIDFPVPPPGDQQLYGLNGLPMVHGLGEGHNADVLLEYPVRLALSPHTRLLIECKGYAGTIGLPIVRGALGLRTDINAFRQLTGPELLRRQVARRPAASPIRHPYYHIAVASLFGFSDPAQSYAAAHHIELLDYAGLPILGQLAETVSTLSVDRFRPENDAAIAADAEAQSLPELASTALSAALEAGDFGLLTRAFREHHLDRAPGIGDFERIFGIANPIRFAYTATLANGLHVHMLATRALPLALLNNGQQAGPDLAFRVFYDKGETETWWLEIDGIRLEFSLPRVLLNVWKETPDVPRGALRIKDQYFRQIDIVGPLETADGRKIIRHLVGVLDRQFFLRAMRDAGIGD